MKNTFPFLTVLLMVFLAACNKSSNGPSIVVNTNPYENIWAGSYKGTYNIQNNGVDSDGVFKTDSVYDYSVKMEDAGNYNITLVHGPVTIPAIPVDSLGYFYFVDYNRNITGHFFDDSLVITSKALNGTYTYPQWFVIQQLTFRGKKEL